MAEIQVVSRLVWGAALPKSRPGMMARPAPYTYIHHTADMGPNDVTPESERIFMRATQRFHQVQRGWNDIAYSFVVMPSGRVYEGRGWGIVGAHTENRNSISHGICFAGNYEVREPTTPAMIACAELLKQGIASGFVAAGPHPTGGHRDTKATACPGKLLYSQLYKIRDMVANNTPAPTPNPEVPGVKPSYNPPLALRPIVSSTKAPEGGVWLLGDDGSVYSFGGATYLGAPNGQPYWGTRKAALIQPHEGGYKITATSGETYHYVPQG